MSLGTSVAGAGDVNGDGYADVIVGAPSAFLPDIPAFPPQPPGEALVFFGGASGIANFPRHTIQGDPAFTYFGGTWPGPET